MPDDIRSFLREIYVALQNGSLRLCALGIRALLEHLMISKIQDQGTLNANITAFFTAGYIAPADQAQFRNKVIGVGDAAMHRGYQPVLHDIQTLLDITEGLIASIFVHPQRAASVGAKMPPRAGKKGPAK